jgi:hypothetical protein
MPDGRSERRRRDITSARSHPELSLGYLAMRPRIDVQLPPEEHRSIRRWSRRMLGGCAAVIALTLGLPVFQQAVSDGVQASERPGFACVGWDDAASEAIVEMVKAGRDVDLRLVGDAVFRMRRARRNCHMGWVRLACLDYHAIMRGAPALSERWLPTAFECSVPDGEPVADIRQRFRPAPTVTASRP